MNCPKCQIPMTKIGVVECKTGNAIQYGCNRCRGKFYKQSTPVIDFRTLREVTAGALQKVNHVQTC